MYWKTQIGVYLIALRACRHRALDSGARQPTNRQPTNQKTSKARNQQTNKATPQQTTRAEVNPQTNQKTTKNQQQIHQNCSKISLGGCLGRLLGPLGASWAHLGAKMAPRAKKVARRTPQDPPTWEPKSTQNRSGGFPKSDHFFDCFWDRVLVPFGPNLGPTWPPKPSQNRAKLAPRSIKKSIKLLTQIFFHF